MKTEYITQEQAVVIAKEAGALIENWLTLPPKLGLLYLTPEQAHATCNAAIQAYRDSLVAGVVLPEPDCVADLDIGPYTKPGGREGGRIYKAVPAWSEPLVRQAIADALAKQVTRAPIAETAHNIKGQHMNKLEEMWAALAAYQSKADAAGHGATWAAMCKERTAEAAVAASNAAAYTAYAAAKAAAVASAVNATADAAAASAASAAASAAADAKAAADAEKWARIAIERINKVLAAVPAQQVTKEQVQPSNICKKHSCLWAGDGCPHCKDEQVQPAQGELEDLLDMYWDLAYAEGHSHGKESYGTKANETRHKIRALLQSNAERVPLEPVNCDTCRYHYKDLYQKPCNTCIHSGDFGSNFEPRFEITKGQQ